MKSPNEAHAAESTAAPDAARRAVPPKPEGGKALMRLLSLLDRRGLHDLADYTIVAKAGEGEYEQVQFARERLSAAPPHLAAEGRSPEASRNAPITATDRSAAIGALYAASNPHAQNGSAPAQVTIAPEGDAAATEGKPRSRKGASAAASPSHETAPLTSPPTPTGPQWRSLGPWTVPNGQTYGSSRVNISGRVSTIAVHPTNPARVLCGAANGGVWESFDRGSSWAPRTDYASTLAVGAIAYDRTNPSRAYCGLGEGNWWSWLGNGILRSLDGGTNWAPLCTSPFVGQGFYDLQVSPTDGQRLFAGTNGGLYVSSDGGVTWTSRRSAPTWSIAIAPGPVATAEILAACSDGLFRSVDGGTTWSAVALPGAPAPFNRLAVAIAASNPAVAYAWGAKGSVAVLLRRAAGGAWSALPLPPGVSTGQAWYDWFLAAPPDRDN